MKQLNNLYDILRYCRSSGSQGEKAMIAKHIEPVTDKVDGYGNLYKRIGTSRVIWSCHTDTVHALSDPERQTVYLDDRHNPTRIFKTDDMCLGADCGTGVWLMLEMMKHNVEGLYIFHRSEEIGGLGSDYIRTHKQSMLKDYDMAIAFDRYGVDSVITHQGGQRCASDDFGDAIAGVLGMGYCLDTGGSFTDTANYTGIIPECTNLSVGYYKQHSKQEYQDVTHLMNLREALLSNAHRFANLPVVRDPKELPDFYDDDYYYGSNALEFAVQDYPEAVATMLRSYYGNISDDEIVRIIEDSHYDGWTARKYY